jgi:hypothetical protein
MDENREDILSEILKLLKNITDHDLKADKDIESLVNDVKEIKRDLKGLKNLLAISPSTNGISRTESTSVQASGSSTISESDAAVVPASVIEVVNKESENQQIDSSPSSPVESVNNGDDLEHPVPLIELVKEEENNLNIVADENVNGQSNEQTVKQEEIHQTITSNVDQSETINENNFDQQAAESTATEANEVVEASHFPAISKSLESRIRFEKEPINFTFYPQIIELSSDEEETNTNVAAQTEQNVNNSAATETFEGISNLQFLQKLIKSSQNKIPVVNVTRLANEQTISETDKAAEENKESEQEVAGTSEQQTSTQETEESTAQLETERNETETQSGDQSSEIVSNEERNEAEDDQESSLEIKRPKRQRNPPKRCHIPSSSDDDEESETNQRVPRKSRRQNVPTQRLIDNYDLEGLLESFRANRQSQRTPTNRNHRIVSHKSSDDENEPNNNQVTRKRKVYSDGKKSRGKNVESESSSSDINSDECASEESLEPVDFHDKKRSDEPDSWASGWNIRMVKIHYAVWTHHESSMFRFPVDSEKFPDYYDVIENPMDLQSVKEKLTTYKSPLEFYDDMKLIFDNSRAYHTKDWRKKVSLNCFN